MKAVNLGFVLTKLDGRLYLTDLNDGAPLTGDIQKAHILGNERVAMEQAKRTRMQVGRIVVKVWERYK